MTTNLQLNWFNWHWKLLWSMNDEILHFGCILQIRHIQLYHYYYIYFSLNIFELNLKLASSIQPEAGKLLNKNNELINHIMASNKMWSYSKKKHLFMINMKKCYRLTDTLSLFSYSLLFFSSSEPKLSVKVDITL